MASQNSDSDKAAYTEDPKFPKNEKLEKEKDYQQDQSNGKEAGDPTAARYTGANGYTQRSDQKDQLENLHIGGSETSPQGGTDHDNANEQQQGPGFEAEGSYELDHNLRTRDQEFGDAAPSGPAKPVAEE